MTFATPKLVILDRDGVINADSDDYIRTPEEFIPFPGSLAAVVRLKQAGLLVAVATNQSGIARGYFTEATLAAMHENLARLITTTAASAGDTAVPNRIDFIEHCPHGPDDGCVCRKPKPGMLEKILSSTGVAATDAVFIGDSASDVGAARAAGVAPILVRSGKGERTLARAKAGDAELAALLAGVAVYPDLAAAVAQLLAIPVDL